MKNKHTEQDINLFFERFKQLPEYFELEEVHQLINNPHAKATHTVNLNYKQLKFIIMTSAFIIGLSTLVWLTNNSTKENEPFTENNNFKSEVHNAEPKTESKSIKAIIYSQNSKIQTNPLMRNCKGGSKGNSVILNEKSETATLLNPEQKSIKVPDKICAWSSDTVIDKEQLIIELSDDEIKKIGIARKGFATFYHDKTPNRNYDMHLSCYSNMIPKEERIITNNEYYVAHVTNSYFEPDGDGNFYTSMDTLVPVMTHNKSNQIYWFTPHASFFKSLPKRYDYLTAVYNSLKCLKRNYPQKAFVNYLENGSASIIDPVKLLELSKEDLINIGVGISDECVTFQSKNRKYTLKHCKNGLTSTGNDEDFAIFPPNPYPVAMTDTFGRRVFVESTIIAKDSLSEIMNILIPVKVDLKKFISDNKKEVIICWFYPTDEFLNALPQNIRPELKSELSLINRNVKSPATSCTYFEACKSTLQIDNLRIYPNPANYTATLEFDNSQLITGTISVANIAGVKLKEVVPKRTFSIGHNSYQLDLSGITSGMYLVSINTDKGFKTQRLIVSH